MTTIETCDTPAAFKAAIPQFGPTEIASLLRTHYGVVGRVSVMASERDLTVGVEVADDRRYVLKIANAAEDPDGIRFQNAALVHLGQVAPELPVSRVIATGDGSTEFFESVRGERHVVRLLTYLPGRPLSDVDKSAAQPAAIGRLLGEVSKAFASFAHRVPEQEILWDMQHASKLLRLTANISDGEMRAKVEVILERFSTAIMPRQANLRRQIIHNDLNPSNILVATDDPERITGILDLGDMVEAPCIYDVAVACAYHVPFEGPPLRLVADLVSAYHSVYPLLEAEIEILFDLMATRHAMTIVISEWRAKLHPENAAYVLRNHANAAQAIARFAVLDRCRSIEFLRHICTFG